MASISDFLIDRRKLEEWANTAYPEGSFWVFSLDKKATDFRNRILGLNFAEGIASQLQQLTLDCDCNGVISKKEIEGREEKVKACVDGYLNLLINFGVVAALVCSVLFPCAYNNFDLSSSSIDFFGYTVTLCCKYLFLACVNFSLMTSLGVIHRSVTQYKLLNFWMVSASSKLLWMKQNTLVPLIISVNFAIGCIAISVPLGAAAAISPIAGLISLLAMAWFWIQYFFIALAENDSYRLLQNDAKQLLDKTNKLQNLTVTAEG